ncbi:hypothetical protein SNEBB_009237 [Seison nebaliae]|nr:hypothetical protein SNEBB_009237 [Seison nebaliae]
MVSDLAIRIIIPFAVLIVPGLVGVFGYGVYYMFFSKSRYDVRHKIKEALKQMKNKTHSKSTPTQSNSLPKHSKTLTEYNNRIFTSTSDINYSSHLFEKVAMSLEVDMNEKMESTEECVTSEQVYHSMKRAWINERMAPELLPYSNTSVDCILQLISSIEKQIGSNTKKYENEFAMGIKQLESQRLHYILSGYLRKRLEKIERFAARVLDIDRKNPDIKLLSSEEVIYAEQYIANMGKMFEDSVLSHLPSMLQGIDLLSITEKPNLNKFIIGRCNEDINNFDTRWNPNENDENLPESDYLINMSKDDQFIISYKKIRPQLFENKFYLI